MDREKVLKGLREMSCRATWKDIDGIRDKFQPIINGAIDLLKEQEVKEQISDVIHEMAKPFRLQIVMCKDCKYYPNGDGSTKWLPCREIITPPGWFCADGERRDG